MEQVRCAKCGELKPLDRFSFKSKAAGVRHKACKDCFNLYQKTAYKARPHVYKDKAKRFQERLKILRDEAKNRPCMDCGGSFPPYVMDFDHRPGTAKLGDPAHLVGRASAKLWRAEISKCDVVCSNCHRIRTHHRETSLP